MQAADAAELVRRAVRREGPRVWFHPKEAYALDAFARVLAVGAGKAAGPMAQALEEVLGDRLTGGLIAVPRGTPAEDLPSRVEVLEAEHPVPGECSVGAAQAVAALASQAGQRDLVVVLVSGGASSLLASPAQGLRLEDLQETWRALLRSGLDIHAMNCVRKHLTALGGGNLARLASPAAVVSLLLSDVPGDRVDSIGSGPSVADPSTFADARAALEAAGLSEPLPERVHSFLATGAAGAHAETPKPGDPVFARSFTRIVGSNEDAVAGALVRALQLGYADAGDFRRDRARGLKGEDARSVGRALGTQAVYLREVKALGYRPVRPVAIVAGGEAPVRVAQGRGQGGRLSELTLAAAEAIDGVSGIMVGALATDGLDGVWDAAGALADGTTVREARAAGLDLESARLSSDTGKVFESVGGKIARMRTRTNVTDLYVALVRP